MSIRVISPVPFLLALAILLASSPADAQGRGGKKQKEKDRQEEVRWEDYDQRPVLQRRANVPPGWCKGKGNPHNTVENCGYQSQNGVYRPGNNGGYGNGSYEQQHADFHRYLDDRYRALAAQRPLDIRWQLEVRSQKSAEHDRWHAQMGRAH